MITCRIAYLLEQGARPYEILAVTFTNRAATEMLHRVSSMVGSELCADLTICTFHSLGYRILRQESTLLGYPASLTVHDTGDQLSLIRRVMRELKVDLKRFDPSDLAGRISLAKNRFQDPKEVRLPLVRKVYGAYLRAQKAAGAVDFDDLISLPVRIFREFPDVKERWSGRFRYVMVDEYQDTNLAQVQLLRELSSVHGNLCVVGDDDQSIYGWRGAEVGNILGFDRQFPGTRVVTLVRNYRSTAPILEAAGAVMEKGKQRRPKRLISCVGDGRPVRFDSYEDEEAEAQGVVDLIQHLRLADRLELGEFAVLYRTNAQARPFEEVMRRERIPYRIVGGQKFFERKEIRDLLAYLKLIRNGQDETALRRIINYPTRGLGTSAVEHLSAFARREGTDLGEALQRAEEVPGLTAAHKRSAGELVGMLNELRRLQHSPGKRPSDLLDELLDRIRLIPALHREYTGPGEAEKRIDMVQAFLGSARSFEERNPRADLDEYLGMLALDNSSDDKGADDKTAQVTLITLHGAKGLEFKVVFLVGVEDGLLPFRRGGGTTDDLEEERRLAYVGMTRARERLFMSMARMRRRRGHSSATRESPFLFDLEGMLEREGEKEEKGFASDKTAKAMFDFVKAFEKDEESE